MNDINLILTGLAALLIMVFVILVVIWQVSKGQKKINSARLQQKELELKLQRELLLNSVLTQEKERDRIAKELHDDIATKLNIVHLHIHLLKNHLPQNEETKKLLKNIETSLTESGENTRNLSHELMPFLIKKAGIQHAIEELSNVINLKKELKMTVENLSSLKISEDFKGLHLYRVIQELVNNTSKYANAKNILINFIENGNDIIMSYSDDGIGFDFNQEKDGLGLGNIKARIELLNGSYEFISTKDNGFTLNIKFPNNDTN